MNTSIGPWMVLACGLPLLAALGSLGPWSSRRRRDVALLSSSLGFAGAVGGLVEWSLRTEISFGDPWLAHVSPGVASSLELSAWTAWAAVWVSLIALVSLVLLPRTERASGRMQRLLLAQGITMVAVFAQSLGVFTAAWVLTALVALPRRTPDGCTRRVLVGMWVVTGLSSALLVAATIGGWTAPMARWPVVVLGLGIWLRKGLWPLQPWWVAGLERLPLSSMLMLVAPQLEIVAVLRWWLPAAKSGELALLAVVAGASALHGAIAAVAASNARRCFAYFFLSQSALVFVALVNSPLAGIGSTLVLWLANALALTGFGWTIRVLEARRGALSLRRYHGGYDQTPMLAMVFLVLGLCAVGFPGTLGFAGVETMVEGLVEASPWLAGLVVVVAMLNGITVLRMYFRLFGGAKAAERADQQIRRREVVGFGALATVLTLTGLWPQWVLGIGFAVAESLGLAVGS